MSVQVVLDRHELRHPDGRRFYVYGTFDGTLDGQEVGVDHDHTHLRRRFDRLTGSWVLVSPSRNQRPGGVVGSPTGGTVRESCPLCPGGAELPWPFEVAVFDNRFPSMSPAAIASRDGLTAGSTGRCQVIVYTADHALTSLTQLSTAQLVDLVAVLRERTASLWADSHDYVMAFENHGVEVGATLSHLHGQIYAFGHLPATIRTKLDQHEHHRGTHGGCLGCAIVADDRDSDRVIAANERFTVAVPFAARWPLEVHVRAIEHGVRRLADLSDDGVIDLARAIHDVVERYDALYGFDLPYMMCVQEAPSASSAAGESGVGSRGPEANSRLGTAAPPGASPAAEDWHLHVEFLPPHRSAHRLKVRASVETALGVFINDTVPEESAARLGALETSARDWSGAVVPEIRAVG